MKRLILMAALAVLILPPPAVGGGKRPVALKEKAHLNDLGREIEGRLEAQKQLQESIKKQSGEGYEDSMKQKRREKAKRLRGQSPKTHFQEPQQQREDLGKAPKH